MTLQYIRDYYGVPAYRGRKIKFDGNAIGVITSGDHHIRVRFDGEKITVNLHPKWHVDYFDAEGLTATCSCRAYISGIPEDCDCPCHIKDKL